MPGAAGVDGGILDCILGGLDGKWAVFRSVPGFSARKISLDKSKLCTKLGDVKRLPEMSGKVF